MHTKRKEAQSRAKTQRHNNSYLFNWLLNKCGNRISSLRKAKKPSFFFELERSNPKHYTIHEAWLSREKIKKNKKFLFSHNRTNVYFIALKR